MNQNRAAQFQAETPFLPTPLAGDVLETLLQPFETRADGEALVTRISGLRTQISAAIDTIELAIAQNHADYLGGRHSWSYDTRIEIDARLRILRRQRQHVQEAFGQCNRRLKRFAHDQDVAGRGQRSETPRALAFVRVATQLLDATTLAVLWEAVDEHVQHDTGAAPATRDDIAYSVAGRSRGSGGDAR